MRGDEGIARGTFCHAAQAGKKDGTGAGNTQRLMFHA
jgi:hypothetical protein